MIEVSQMNCTGCGACLQICPVQCIEMKMDEEGFEIPKVNIEKCIKCKRCEDVCPEKNVLEGVQEGTVYAYKNSRSEIRKKSTSGGFFYACAEMIIKEEGYVYGAIYNDELKVVHSSADNMQEVCKMMGSKYVQSDMGNCYVDVRKLLLENKKILFTGTPCQIAGLKRYLGKEYANLVTIQLICHGVPSPLLFEKYKNYLKQKYHMDILKHISFRDDEGYRIRIRSVDRTIYLKGSTDLFLRPFLKGLNYRYCCYNCKYAHNHIADITIGDFWGAEKVMPDFYEDGGMSCVIVNTEKGKEVFDIVVEEIENRKSRYSDAARKNQNLLKPTSLPKERKDFYVDLEKQNYIKKLQKYVPLKARIGGILPKQIVSLIDKWREV